MERICISLALAAAAFVLTSVAVTPAANAQSQAAPAAFDPAGTWAGAIEAPNRLIAISVSLAVGADGWSGSIEIPAAGVSGLGLTNVTVGACATATRTASSDADTPEGTADDVCISFSVAGLPGPPTFSGTVSDSGRMLSGMFREGAEVLLFTLRRGDVSDATSPGSTPREAATAPVPGRRAEAQPATPNRPQNPQSPLPYENRDVAFRNDVAKLTLAGTLVLPPGDGPFPAVVFASGSGPQDRDETVAGHRPFLVIADALARRGVASLRYDDRGVGGSEGDLSQATHEDLAGDITAAVAFLAAQPGIDTAAIGVIGHSEGGLTGPRAAVRDERIAFLVLLAPPGEPLAALSLRQNRAALRARGVAETLADRVIAALRKDYVLVQDTSIDTHELRSLLRARIVERRETYSDEERATLQLNDAALRIVVEQATSPWFRSLMREDPALHLQSLRVPVLALFGEKDVQVAADVNAPIVADALAKAATDDVEVHTLSGLNHLLQPATTGTLDEYYAIDVTVAPEVLEQIADWITSRYSHARDDF